MTDIQRAEAAIEEAQQKLISAKRRLDEVINEQDFPRSASKYWYLINFGDRWEVRWSMFGGGSKVDQRRRAAGNCYRTEHEAKEVCDTRNTLTEKMEGWI